MDLVPIGRILHDLLLANECEAAALLDVEDTRAHIKFYERKLAIMEARHKETQDACQEVCDRLSEAVTQATMAPLTLMRESDNADS